MLRHHHHDHRRHHGRGEHHHQQHHDRDRCPDHHPRQSRPTLAQLWRPIMKPSIDQGSEEACPHALGDDDAAPSIETVIASLGSRSDAEREALLKALLDGRNQAPPDPHGASSIPKTVGKQQFLPVKGADCSPTVSPNAVGNRGSNHSETTIIRRSRCSPMVPPNRDRGLWLRGSIFQCRVRRRSCLSVPPQLRTSLILS